MCYLQSYSSFLYTYNNFYTRQNAATSACDGNVMCVENVHRVDANLPDDSGVGASSFIKIPCHGAFGIGEVPSCKSKIPPPHIPNEICSHDEIKW